ncbi:hypothetical protein ACVIHI_003471 [Bradyrhizobium sp. USDA 4524]|uniref:hypothetical protein n=1 Tax=unclassified Bradyrhizobium TaxID=2631580 RepID=UPI0020A024D3|nr:MULTISPECIES: hypothetical protein [unclassified Bradyrhizobium]MCP1843611.1 hypothetical protein [Bradyrhizobium sp. USDA 4538]MCP1904177.1 hypothetical protein [Bradyrhizobium sp. USDA 4537]MCP1990167.1 hypothetical protein [Bradyrhizobium sp. USDA 4539]
MKIVFCTAIVLSTLAVAPANARERNDSPHSQACMAKNGFNLDMWRAHSAGTDAQVLRYIQCRDRVSAAQAKAIGIRDHNFSAGYR